MLKGFLSQSRLWITLYILKSARIDWRRKNNTSNNTIILKIAYLSKSKLFCKYFLIWFIFFPIETQFYKSVEFSLLLIWYYVALQIFREKKIFVTVPRADPLGKCKGSDSTLKWL